MPEASRVLADAPLDRIFVLDHIPTTPLDPALAAERLHAVDSSGLLAGAIRAMSGRGDDDGRLPR